MILRKERPHPGAQLTFTDVDGHRITALLTNTPPEESLSGPAGLELRHRQHARVEDRIREAKATSLRNLPCRGFTDNAAWLEVVLTAMDLLCWAKQISFADVDELVRREMAAFRYRVLHVAARLTARPTGAPTHRYDLALGRVHLTTAAPAPNPRTRNPPTRRDSRALPMPPDQHSPQPPLTPRSPRPTAAHVNDRG